MARGPVPDKPARETLRELLKDSRAFLEQQQRAHADAIAHSQARSFSAHPGHK
jgi:hypothetical protein